MDLRTAEAQLISSRENYVRLVGDTPDDLAPPPPLPNLPVSPDAAVDVAIANNPDIAAARKETQAAASDVKVARASRLPTVSATADGGYIDYWGRYRKTGVAEKVGKYVSILVLAGTLKK